MTKSLFAQAMIKFICGVILIGALIFLPAGTLNFWQGWLFMGVLFIPMFLAGLVMMWKNPGLLAKRLDAKEKEMEQSLVIKLSGLMFLCAFIVAGLDHRFQWSNLDPLVVLIATGVFLLSYALYGEVLRVNTYLSRTIQVEADQKVIDTGLYGVVRHPMYMATLLLFLSMPLILGSVYSFFILLVYPALIIKRLKHEEELLLQELEGYDEYMKKVKYRLIPFIW